MTTPPEPSGSTNILQDAIAALGVLFLSLAGFLMRKAGKEPRPTQQRGPDRSEEILQAIQGLQDATNALSGKVSHILAVQDNHRDRLITLEVARDNPRGIPHAANS